MIKLQKSRQSLLRSTISPYFFKRAILRLVTGGFLGVVLLVGCGVETSREVLSTIFDGADSPPPPTRRVRRDLLREIEELKRELAEARRELTKAREVAKAGRGPAAGAAHSIEQAKSWKDAAELLPKDRSGRVEWTRALKAGTIAPRPSLDPKAPDQAVLELDVDLVSSPSKLFSVTFPHAAHTRWLTCGNCHPTIFPLRRGANPTVVTMAKIRSGQYCGACHGKVAFGIEGRCARCHAKFPAATDWHPTEKAAKPIERASTWEEAAKLLPVTAGTPDWAKALADGVIAPRPGIDPKARDQPVLPLDLERVPAAGAMFKAIFPHKAHTAWLACTDCHPGIFQMAKGAEPITMDKINAGKSCGVCHGKVAFAATACGRCHPAMAGGK